jgi:predicted dehydrogenase
VLAKMRGAELAAICDNDGAKARALADRFGVPDVFTDIEDLLEFDQLDAVVIATPNHLHEPHALSALAAGVHVLCERPLALTAAGIDRIVAAAKRADRMVIVANNHRFRNDVQALDGFLRGVFLDAGLPLLDLALWLADFPEVTRVSAHMERGRGANAVDEAMLAVLSCAQGATFTFDLSRAYVGDAERWWFEVMGTRGSGRLAPLRVVKELNGRPTDVSPSGAATRDSAFIQSYRAELAHFLSVLREQSPYEPPTDQARVQRVMEAIYRSADEGHEIQL